MTCPPAEGGAHIRSNEANDIRALSTSARSDDKAVRRHNLGGGRNIPRKAAAICTLVRGVAETMELQ